MASIEWSTGAISDLGKIDIVIARRILFKISWFGENFSSTIPEKLHGSLRGLYKFRVGDYRIIYSLEEMRTIIIQAIGHRREVYKNIR